MQQALAKDLEQKPLPAIDRPAVMFVISKTYAGGVSQERLYEATRGNWRIGAGSRAQAEIALGIADGMVRTAFEIDRWGGADESAAPWTAKAEDNRWYFEGHETEETSSWLGLSVRHLAPPKGAANPVRLFLDGIPGPEQESIADSSTVLQDEALGRIMFGNSELFHSNLIAWIFEKFPSQADSVFGSFVSGAGDGSGDRRVERERENLDLVMHWPDRGSLVIENKVFAVPSPQQLDGYAVKMAKWKLPVGGAMLLSPTRHHFLDDGYVTAERGKDGCPIVWRHLSFETLAESLELAFDGAPQTYEVETVLRYCTVLRGLAAMMAQARVASTREIAFLNGHALAQSLPKQAVTGLMKARAAHTAAALRYELERLGVPAGGVDSGLSHSLPRVSWFMEVMVGNVPVHAGWQYQGGVLSLALILDHLEGTGSAAKLKRAEFARLHPEFFSFDHLDGILDTKNTAVSATSKPEGPFGHFDPNFIYRSKKVKSLSVQQLIDASTAHAGHLARVGRKAGM